MKILIDLCHPAHLHFFKHPIQLLRDRGHEIILSGRDKDCLVPLLEQAPFQDALKLLTKIPYAAKFRLARELWSRNHALIKLIRKEKPDRIAAVAGTFAAQSGYICRTPAYVFYDSRNAVAQNCLTYPFASQVIVPEWYSGWTPKDRTIRYHGFHEHAYLRPKYFTADKEVAIKQGLSATGKNFFIRLVAFQASHDIGHSGIDEFLLGRIINFLAPKGKIIISSEIPLPNHLQQYQYTDDPKNIHHVMAFCDLFVGDSPTMASESAALGVPGVYVSSIRLDYATALEERFKLLHCVHDKQWARIEHCLQQCLERPNTQWKDLKQVLLEKTVDTTKFVTNILSEA